MSAASGASVSARSSASVRLSRTPATALRASTMIRRTAQVLRSAQSSQGAEGGDGGAGNRRERSVENAHDGADADLVRRPGERVAAALALLGIDQSRVPQLGQYVVEELLRDRIALGDVGDLGERARLDSCEMNHGLEAVFALVGQHVPSSSPAAIGLPEAGSRGRNDGFREKSSRSIKKLAESVLPGLSGTATVAVAPGRTDVAAALASADNGDAMRRRNATQSRQLISAGPFVGACCASTLEGFGVGRRS